MSYESFAAYYDEFTQNVDYKAMADYIEAIYLKFNQKPQVLLDLGCGTGSLTYQLAQRGYTMIGADASEDMLAVGSAKDPENRLGIQWVQQRMEGLSLPRRVDGVVCSLDSINHLSDIQGVDATFKRLSACLGSGGLFVFDVNSFYKMEQVLGNQAYILESPSVFLSWQNFYNPDSEAVDIQLDFFQEVKDGYYERQTEEFTETYYSGKVLKELLEKWGFELLEIYEEGSFSPPSKKAQRLVYIARRQ